MNYDWKLSNAYPPTKSLKVFGAFVCGGGSTMGYKLAGLDHLGGIEINSRMADIYQQNHQPQYLYREDIRLFNQRDDLPEVLFNLDILDGSPPCTSFSIAGKREKHWGKAKRFKEGKTKQVLDDLVFVYCDTIAKLRPKIALLENVRGLISGKAKYYAMGIWERLEASGYEVQLFLLNSATMGVPQSRERVFYIARRKDLNFPRLQLHFAEEPVRFGQIADKGSKSHRPLWKSLVNRLPFVIKGEPNFRWADMRYRKLKQPKAFFGSTILYDEDVPRTLTASGSTIYWEEQRNINATELKRMSSFPEDYDFMGADARFVCGMSVPPLMIARIAQEINRQWFCPEQDRSNNHNDVPNPEQLSFLPGLIA